MSSPLLQSTTKEPKMSNPIGADAIKPFLRGLLATKCNVENGSVHELSSRLRNNKIRAENNTFFNFYIV